MSAAQQAEATLHQALTNPAASSAALSHDTSDLAHRLAQVRRRPFARRPAGQRRWAPSPGRGLSEDERAGTASGSTGTSPGGPCASEAGPTAPPAVTPAQGAVRPAGRPRAPTPRPLGQARQRERRPERHPGSGRGSKRFQRRRRVSGGSSVTTTPTGGTPQGSTSGGGSPGQTSGGQTSSGGSTSIHPADPAVRRHPVDPDSSTGQSRVAPATTRPGTPLRGGEGNQVPVPGSGPIARATDPKTSVGRDACGWAT